MAETPDIPNSPNKTDLQEASEAFKELSVELFKSFLMLEQQLKTAAALCVELGERLADSNEEANNIEEGDTNVNE